MQARVPACKLWCRAHSRRSEHCQPRPSPACRGARPRRHVAPAAPPARRNAGRPRLHLRRARVRVPQRVVHRQKQRPRDAAVAQRERAGRQQRGSFRSIQQPLAVAARLQQDEVVYAEPALQLVLRRAGAPPRRARRRAERRGELRPPRAARGGAAGTVFEGFCYVRCEPLTYTYTNRSHHARATHTRAHTRARARGRTRARTCSRPSAGWRAPPPRPCRPAAAPPRAPAARRCCW